MFVQTRRPMLAVLSVSALAVTPAAAFAVSPTKHQRHQAKVLRAQVVKAKGKRAPGRAILRDGLRNGSQPNQKQAKRYIETLQRILHPPAPPKPVYHVVQAPVSNHTSTPQPSSTTTTNSQSPTESSQSSSSSSSSGSNSTYSTPSSGSGTPPSYVAQCESGGDYHAVNPSSGAGGKWQILPSTWAAQGGQGSPQNASPQEQDRIAGKIWNGGAGASQWSCAH